MTRLIFYRRIICFLVLIISVWIGASGQEGLEGDTLARVTAGRDRLQEIRQSHKVIYFGDITRSTSADSVRRLMDQFYLSQFRHFQDPRSPYFLMMSRDAKLAMGIGGTVRMRGFYDFGGAMPSNAFLPYTIPVPEDKYNRRKLSATPAGTAIYFQIIGVNKTLGNFSAFIQGNFDGYEGTGFRLKKSYVIINDWTIGYNTSTFVDPMANPPVIDASGPNGQTNNTSVLLRWMHTIKSRWMVAASVEFPSTKADADNALTRKQNDWFPDVVAFGQYQWAETEGHLRLSGLLRVMPYYDLVKDKAQNKIGWGAHLSVVSPLGYNWKVYGSVVGGAGISSYSNDMMADRLDLLNDPDKPGEMYAPYSFGFTAGVRYNFTPNIYSSVSVSRAQLFPRLGEAAPSYRHGLYCVVNLFWEMSARLQTGVEYLFGRRTNRGGDSGSAQRVNLLFAFSF